MNQTYYKMVCDFLCTHVLFIVFMKFIPFHKRDVLSTRIQTKQSKDKLVQKTESYITHHFSQKKRGSWMTFVQMNGWAIITQQNPMIIDSCTPS